MGGDGGFTFATTLNALRHARFGVLLLMTLQAFPASAAAGQRAYEKLLLARSLKCEFQPGALAEWKSDRPVLKTTYEKFALHFDAIDIKKGTARLIGNQGAGDVTLWTTIAGLHFVEQTGFGSIMVTTVFSTMVPGGFVAVTSRHIDMMMTPPLPSQTHGTCAVWESKR
jgi:hypothetical protein